MKITFIGATHEVTGSCYYLEAAGKKFLVDCGMEQGPDYYENKDIPVPPGELDFVLLTHAHMDHSGKDLYMPQRQPVIFAILCSVTVPISRCLRQNGVTARQNVRGSLNLFQLIPWRMH